MFTRNILNRFAAMLTAVLAVAPLASAYTPDFYTQESKMAKGTWVKVTVDACGIYQLTYDQLRAIGFTNPENVTVYGYGANTLTDNTFRADLPDDLQPTAMYHTPDDRILFYAEAQVSTALTGVETIAIKRNHYDTTGAYFLSDVAGAIDIPAAPYVPSDAAPITFQYDIKLIENDLHNPGEGGAIFHDQVLEPGKGQNLTFNVRDFDNSANINATGYFRYVYAARSVEKMALETVLPSNVTIRSSANQSVAPVFKTNKLFNMQFGFARFIKDGRNSLEDDNITFRVSCPASSVADYVALDYAYIVYPRTFRLRRLSQLLLHVGTGTAGTNFTVGDATADTQIWNVDNPSAIYPYETVYDPATQTMTATLADSYSFVKRPGRIIAFTPSVTFPEPKIAGFVPNQNIHGDETPDMVIITTTTLLDHALELAEAHERLQGMKVNVYTQEQVYNEFSSGSRAAMAYRRLAKMFYDRDPQKFRYLLLYGAASWDNRGVVYTDRDHLIAYEAELDALAGDTGTNFCADSYFGILADDYDPNNIVYGLMDIGVGRIPAQNTAKATQFNKKLIAYMTNPPSPRAMATVVGMSDDGNRMSHIQQSEAVLDKMSTINPAITAVRAHNLLYPWTNFSAVQLRSVVTDALTRGAGYFTYSGHGNAETFASERVWSKVDAEKVSYSVYPITMFATCDALAFDRLENGIGETMLFSANGGSIALVGACRSVYLEYNQNMNEPFGEAYARATRGTCVGDLFRYAYNHSKIHTADPSAMANSMCYNLVGDPAMPVYAPSHTAIITHIGGNDVRNAEEGSVAVTPLSSVAIEGIVAAPGSNKPDETFDGTAEIVLYEAPRSMMTVTKDGSTDAEDFPVELDETPLVAVNAKVEAGRFIAHITAPHPAMLGSINRLTAFATHATDVTLRATGATYAVSVAGDSDLVDADAEAPRIIELYVGGTDGAEFVDTDVVVEALIDPSASGLKLGGGLIGSPLRVMLDASKSFPRADAWLTFDSDGPARLSMPISGLQPGRHRLSLLVTNNAGLTDERVIEFVSGSAAPAAVLRVDEAPARTSATFSLEGAAQGRLVVCDTDGRTVVSRPACAFPFTWDLRDTQGHTVPDGLYRAFVIATADGADISTPAIEVVVLK